MLLAVLKVAVPLMTVICLGILCRKKKILAPAGVEGMKKLVSAVLLPALVFSSFSTMDLSLKTLLIVLCSLLLQFFSFAVGAKTTKCLGKYGKYHRFLCSSSEPGMLGYALYALLYGADRIAPMILLDAGLASFFFPFFLPRLLQANDGKGGSALKAAAKSPVLFSLLIALLLNITGLYDKILPTAAGGILTDTLSMLSTPVTCLMLFSVGYGMQVEREILRPVLRTSLIRLCAFLPLGTLMCLLLPRFGFGREYQAAVLLFCCLPASYLVSAYVQGEEQQRYANTQLSLHAAFSVPAVLLLKLWIG